MIALFNTAERAGDTSIKNTYLLSRHQAAYQFAERIIMGHVLELGCGNGYGMKQLYTQCTTYTGIDKYVNSKIQLSNNAAIVRSMLPEIRLVRENYYDVVICFQVIEHIQDDRKMMTEIYRVLKPGGKLLLTTPNAIMTLTRNPYHVRE